MSRTNRPLILRVFSLVEVKALSGPVEFSDNVFVDLALGVEKQSFWNRKALPQTVGTKVEACNCLKCLCVLLH